MELSLRLRNLVVGEDNRKSLVNNESEASKSNTSILDSKSDALYYPSDVEGSRVLLTSQFH